MRVLPRMMRALPPVVSVLPLGDEGVAADNEGFALIMRGHRRQ
jgi:hypothetical protein